MQSLPASDLCTEYDYVILGSGAAGATLASVLASAPMRVLVIEAGPTARSRNLKLPCRYPHAFGSRWDWSYRTVPQAGLASRRIPLPSGRMLGGSTGINAMIFLEPALDLWDEWAAVAGDRWSRSAVIPCFERFRRWLHSVTAIDSPPSLTASDRQTCLPSTPPLSPWMEAMFQSAQCLGWTASQLAATERESNGFARVTPGIDRYQRMQRHGRRISAWEIASRLHHQSPGKTSILHTLTHATAQRVLFDRQTAIGVEAQRDDGEIVRVHAKRGVLVCAGTLNSPHILLRSGIGPREWLKRLRIECVREAPQLGLDLQDHLVFPIVYESALPMTPNGGAIHGRLRREDRLQYLQHRTGPLASNLAELGAFMNCRQPPSPGAYATGIQADASADFQWHITPTHYLDYPHGKSDVGCISIGITHMRPRSRGRMVPDMEHADDHPASLAWNIDPGYLHASEEIDAWIQAIGWTRNCFEDATWRSVLGREILPGSKRANPDALEVALRRLATTLYHYSSTCSMGSTDDATLDPTMRVRGVDRLWVCDASSMPVMPNCNPQASIMMMAHRLAGALLDETP